MTQPSMRPVAVIPMNDPEGVMFPHLETIIPLLKSLFARLFVSVPLPTQQALPHYMDWLKTDDFFHVIYHQNDVAIGDDFLTLYAQAAFLLVSLNFEVTWIEGELQLSNETTGYGYFGVDEIANMDIIEPHLERIQDIWEIHDAPFIR